MIEIIKFRNPPCEICDLTSLRENELNVHACSMKNIFYLNVCIGTLKTTYVHTYMRN